MILMLRHRIRTLLGIALLALILGGALMVGHARPLAAAFATYTEPP